MASTYLQWRARLRSAVLSPALSFARAMTANVRLAAALFVVPALAKARIPAGDRGHLGLDVVRHHQERRVHERARLRRRLQERNVLRLRKSLALRLRHLPRAVS